MNRLKKTILLFLLLGAFVPKALPQDISTEGTDFWVSFMGNGFDTNNNGGNIYLKTQVLINSLQACTGVISNPYTGWSTQFEVEANGVVFIDIPRAQAYMECNEYASPLGKGLHIVTDQPVSAYCANAARYSFDASYVLPTPALADDYIIQTYDQSSSTDEHTSAFLIIAVEEGETTIDITPTVPTLDGKAANQEYSVTLHQGQVYQVRSNHSSSIFGGPSRDLSGSRVVARDCKKIAVFNGNTLTMVPTSGSDSDCIFEQAMPVQAWGKQFVVTASLGRQYKDYVKITSASDDNEITVNGQHYTTLSANESVCFQMSGTSSFIEASSRCAVFLYNHSKDGTSSTSIGAPSMVWIAPIEQRISDLAFNTFNDEVPGHVSVDRHYVNIIVDSNDAGSVFLDGELIPENQFEAVAGNSSYLYYRQQISHGAHHLSCEGGFNAHVYGFGSATGYAYMVGSKAADLTTSISVNEVPINPLDTVFNCAMDDITFQADVNLIDYNLVWNFGDGTTSTDNPAVHHYSNNGLFEATLTVTTSETPCGGSTTANTSHFFIDVRPVDTEPEYISGPCDFFEWHGNTYNASGIYTDTVPDSVGCYKVHHLELELQFTPNPSDIYPADTANTAPHWVTTATEFQINDYDFMLWDLNPACHWDTVVWSLESEDATWVLEPLGAKAKRCKVYVLNRVEDTVWLKAMIYNECHPEGIEQRYWLVCSFYGIEEDGTSAGSGAFNVTPNPNNGQMYLHFEHLTGPVDLKVYDMHGRLTDQIQFVSETDSFTLPYRSDSRAEGLYLFVATCKNATLTKKVIISH